MRSLKMDGISNVKLIFRKEQWFEIVRDIYSMEKLTYLLRVKVNIFDKNWEKWIIYSEHDAEQVT